MEVMQSSSAVVDKAENTLKALQVLFTSTVLCWLVQHEITSARS